MIIIWTYIFQYVHYIFRYPRYFWMLYNQLHIWACVEKMQSLTFIDQIASKILLSTGNRSDLEIFMRQSTIKTNYTTEVISVILMLKPLYGINIPTSCKCTNRKPILGVYIKIVSIYFNIKGSVGCYTNIRNPVIIITSILIIYFSYNLLT